MSKRPLGTAVVALGFVMAACTGGGQARDGNEDATAALTAPTVAGATTIPRLTTPTLAGDTTTTTAAVAVRQKANANVASPSEIAAALQANGVEDAGRWAMEVVQYRPYPTNDPSFAKLRQNLAKHDPSESTLDTIVASLSL